jgi:hypothetical protein
MPTVPPKAPVGKVEKADVAASVVPVAPAPGAAEQGTLQVTGANIVKLAGSAGATGAGSVPAGTYVATVSFANGFTIELRGIRVDAGKTTRVQCDELFAICKVFPPA